MKTQTSLAQHLADALTRAGVNHVEARGDDVLINGVSSGLVPTGDLEDLYPGAVLIRHRIPSVTKRQFERDAAGWVDHRSVNVQAPGLAVIAPHLHSNPTPDRQVRVFAGPAVSAATIHALARWPQPIKGVRALAETADVSPGGVSLALKRLVEVGLLTEDWRATPDLFWAAAREWRPNWTSTLIDTTAPGLVEVGPRVAAELGAPLPAGSDSPPEVLAATPTDMQLAIGYGTGEPAVIALAPSPLLVPYTGCPPETLKVAAALTLATDPGRGTEIVENWEGTHVWG